jgi:hypothetical protein
MKEIHEYEKDLSSIRNMMERSVKFISLSGLSGVLAGIYALAGSTAAYFLISASSFRFKTYENGGIANSTGDQTSFLFRLLAIALVVLIASLLTGIWLSHRKARKYDIKLWNSASKRLLTNVAIPLVTGGMFILIILYTGHYGIAAPASLIFYGLALIQGSQHTYDEVRYLGFCEIALGLIALTLPGFGLIFWALGFGVLHIIYGTLMYYRHDK